MRFASDSLFEKHLRNLSQDRFPNLFLLISSCDYEKALWSRLVLSYWKGQAVQVKRFSAPETPKGEIEDEIRCANLWGGVKVLLIDAIDKVKPLFSFIEIVSHAAKDVVVLFLATSSKSLTEIVQRKDVITLDVSQEKPWEKDQRLQSWMKDQVNKEGKQISSEVAAKLFQKFGPDVGALDQELKKVITYIGEKKSIEASDIEAICGSKELQLSWNLAEMLVWKGPVALQEKVADLTFIFPFIGQVRYHLQLGAQLAEFAQKNSSLEEIQNHFRTLRSQNLNKWVPIAKERKKSFFLRGLLELYSFELDAKSSSLDLGIAFDRFQATYHAQTHFAS